MVRRMIQVVTMVALAGCSSYGGSGGAGGAGLETAVEPVAAEPQPAALGFFSLEQARRGRESFETVCSECHFTREFRGSQFEFDWRRQTVWDLYKYVSRNMPEDMPGFLPAQQYADVIAYILEINEYASSSSELVPSEEAMDIIPLGPGAVKTPSQDGGNL